MTEDERTPGELLPVRVRQRYSDWLMRAKELSEFGGQILQEETFKNYSEDLGDWVDSITTLLSFSPEPGPNGIQEFYPDYRDRLDEAMGEAVVTRGVKE